MKNTEYKLKFVDLIAFNELLESCEIEWIVNKSNTYLTAVFDRYSMDQNGYHNGYEYFTIKWKIFKKEQLGIAGIPTRIFPDVIIPSNFEITKIQGAERNNRNYFKPDKDFVYHEIDNWLSINLPNLLEAKFNKEDITWTIGDFFGEIIYPDPSIWNIPVVISI